MTAEIRQRIADEGIKYANACEVEASKDERKMQSTSYYRMQQDQSLKEIRRLTQELNNHHEEN